jgi:hypothetical protein
LGPSFAQQLSVSSQVSPEPRQLTHVFSKQTDEPQHSLVFAQVAGSTHGRTQLPAVPQSPPTALQSAQVAPPRPQ